MFHASSTPALGLATCAWRDTPLRESVSQARALGYRAVQLDATHPECRPRALDRSGRRDLAALLRRSELSLTGLDLWLPPAHLTGGTHLERAIDALTGAIGLVRELAGLLEAHAVVCLTQPDEPDPQALGEIVAVAERHGVALADHAWPAKETGSLGLDPALLVMAGVSPAKMATSLGSRLASARLSDAGVAGRVAVGSSEGRLEVGAYAAALSISAPHIPVVADVRMLPDPASAAAIALEAWRRASALPLG